MYAGSEVPVFPTATDNGLWRALVPTTPLDTPGSRTLKVLTNVETISLQLTCVRC